MRKSVNLTYKDECSPYVTNWQQTKYNSRTHPQRKAFRPIQLKNKLSKERVRVNTLVIVQVTLSLMYVKTPFRSANFKNLEVHLNNSREMWNVKWRHCRRECVVIFENICVRRKGEPTFSSTAKENQVKKLKTIDGRHCRFLYMRKCLNTKNFHVSGRKPKKIIKNSSALALTHERNISSLV